MWPAPPIFHQPLLRTVQPLRAKTTHLDELSEDETGGSGTDQEDFCAKRHLELVHSVDSARGRLEQGRLFVGEVLDLVTLGELAVGQSQAVGRGSWDYGTRLTT